MNLLIKEKGHAFLVISDLRTYMPLWKEFQLLQILSDLSFKNSIKFTLREYIVNILKFTASPV